MTHKANVEKLLTKLHHLPECEITHYVKHGNIGGETKPCNCEWGDAYRSALNQIVELYRDAVRVEEKAYPPEFGYQGIVNGLNDNPSEVHGFNLAISEMNKKHNEYMGV